MDNLRKQAMKAIDDLFADSFYTVLNTEAKYVSKLFGNKLSVTEMHILKAVDDTTHAYCGKVADRLSIKTPSLTVTANKLVDKGYLKRVVDENDKRKIKLILTDMGEECLTKHKQFHNDMIEKVISEVEDENLDPLIKAITNVNRVLRSYKERI